MIIGGAIAIGVFMIGGILGLRWLNKVVEKMDRILAEILGL